ncbi:DNA-binding response regulator [Candidatus Sulfopaludibacter sp. SbA4]|nr:DNA-binding response regulator [Candidatus Sulfopaludibacter sp. SbA4]
MIRVLIADDEQPVRLKLRRFLDEDPRVLQVRQARSGADAIQRILSFHPDLVFLDVQMPDMDGFAVLKAVPTRDFHVVLLTTDDQQALRAFEAEALDYLVKPMDRERFERVLKRARRQIALDRLDRASAPTPEPDSMTRQYPRRLVFEKDGEAVFVPVEHLDWVEADGDHVRLNVGREWYVVHGTMEGLLGDLDPQQFVRISRSTLVKVDRIRQLEPWEYWDRRIILKDGTELRWSRRYGG